MVLDASWHVGIIKYAVDVISISVSSNMLRGPMAPGSLTLIGVTFVSALISLGVLINLIKYNVDPYPYGIIYSGTLMLLCVEVWFQEDPELFNGSRLKGYPFFLFHDAGAAKTKAPVPMSSYTRVFGAWHAGGVCLCFFVHVLANDFPLAQKAQISLALGLLWLIWAAINQWRTIYGAAQFCQMAIMVHSLTGPGCGLCGYWQLWYWYVNRTSENYTVSECILLGTFASYFLCATVWLLTQERKEAAPDLIDGRQQEGRRQKTD
uniref:Uncharacterized protein n=1 Tax=Ditylum brightwellii TaxID=49249 RepID=A0A7S4SUW7_9STRA